MNTTETVSMKEAYGKSYEMLMNYGKGCRYFKEIVSLMRTLNKHGFDPFEVNDGEEVMSTPTQKEAAVAICNVDESRLYVKKRSTGKELGLLIILGNGPGEAVADYHVDPDLDAATEEHYNRWEK